MNRQTVGLWAVVCCLLAASPAWAKRLVAESFHSDIQVQSDGSVRVTETLRFRFRGGPFTSVTRSVPRRDVDGIEMIRSNAPYAFVGTGRNAPLRWTFEPLRDTTRTIVLEYVARGAVEVRGAELRLDWPLVPRNRKYQVENATAVLHWPPRWNARELRARDGRVTRTADSATFERRRLSDEAKPLVRARFSSPDPLPIPAWQAVRDERRQHWGTIALCTAAVFLLGLGLVIAQAREAGVASLRIDPMRDAAHPPANLPPALAGAIWRGSSQWNDMVATLVDLAQRGYVVIEARPGQRGRASGAWNLRRTSLAAGLAAWERVVLETVFPQADERVVPASRLWTPLSRQKAAFEAAVRMHLRQSGLYDPHADEARTRLRATAGVWCAATVALAAAAPFVWPRAGEGALILPLGALGVALVAFALANNIPRHSTHGRQSAAAWAGYREFLRKLAGAEKPPGDPNWFQHQAGYAVALGVCKPWLMAAAKWTPPIPAWFRLPAEGGGGIADVVSWLASLANAEGQTRGLAADPALAALLARRRVA